MHVHRVDRRGGVQVGVCALAGIKEAHRSVGVAAGAPRGERRGRRGPVRNARRVRSPTRGVAQCIHTCLDTRSKHGTHRPSAQTVRELRVARSSAGVHKIRVRVGGPPRVVDPSGAPPLSALAQAGSSFGAGQGLRPERALGLEEGHLVRDGRCTLGIAAEDTPCAAEHPLKLPALLSTGERLRVRRHRGKVEYPKSRMGDQRRGGRGLIP